MTQTITKTTTDNNLKTHFETALANRPDWAQSFTATMTGNNVRITYSDKATFGVGLQEAMNYIERH